MRDLLRHAAGRGLGGTFTRTLLEGFGGVPAPAPQAAAEDAGPRLLTARELEILRLIAAGMRTREIADQLFISPATVKRHIANVYTKLDVRHRTDALLGEFMGPLRQVMLCRGGGQVEGHKRKLAARRRSETLVR